MNITDEKSLARVANMLGVDELIVSRNMLDPDMIVRARLGTQWQAATLTLGDQLYAETASRQSQRS